MFDFVYNIPQSPSGGLFPILIKPVYSENETFYEAVIPCIGEDKSYFMFLDDSGDVNFHFWGKHIPDDLKGAEDAISRAIFERDI